jgi:uncharacterized protein YdaU (DUF1376 family)
MNFYPFHIGDYAAHTRHLTIYEDLAYRRLIDAYYLAEKPFVGSITNIAKSVGMSQYESEVLYILQTFFSYNEEGYSNKRADEEIAKYKAMQEGGRKGAAVRWGKGSDSPPKHPPIQTKNQEPLTKNHINTPEGVSESVFKDYLEVRKTKKAKWTDTALKGLTKEAEKAGLSLQEAMELCCARGWVGFKADWVKDQDVVKPNNDKQWMFSDAGIVAKAAELGVHSIGLTYPQLKEKCLLMMAKKAMA